MTWAGDQPICLIGPVLVTGEAVLTIKQDTTIVGTPGSMLVVTRDARIEAVGTESAPIVFTSAKPPGTRAAGDWGGVALLGSAPINRMHGDGVFEGLASDDPRGTFGGGDDDDLTSNCGTLKYVRIEFTGQDIRENDTNLSALTLAGCGSATRIEFVQAHRGVDDGVEFYGGTVDIKHVVVSGASDESLNWALGYRGRGQFLVLVQFGGTGNNGIEGSNQSDDAVDADPRSRPELFNVTMIGPGGRSQGMRFRTGSWGTMQNAIIDGFGTAVVNVEHEDSVTGTTGEPIELTIEHSIFLNTGSDGHFPAESGPGDDGGFDEEAFFTDPARSNLVDVDPMFVDKENFRFKPSSEGPAVDDPATAPDDGFFDIHATYRGALNPNGTDWTSGWTAYPQD